MEDLGDLALAKHSHFVYYWLDNGRIAFNSSACTKVVVTTRAVLADARRTHVRAQECFEKRAFLTMENAHFCVECWKVFTDPIIVKSFASMCFLIVKGRWLEAHGTGNPQQAPRHFREARSWTDLSIILGEKPEAEMAMQTTELAILTRNEYRFSAARYGNPEMKSWAKIQKYHWESASALPSTLMLPFERPRLPKHTQLIFTFTLPRGRHRCRTIVNNHKLFGILRKPCDGQTNNRIDGLTGRQADEQTDGRTVGHTVERTVGRTGGRSNGRTDGVNPIFLRTDGRTDGLFFRIDFRFESEPRQGWAERFLRGATPS